MKATVTLVLALVAAIWAGSLYPVQAVGLRGGEGPQVGEETARALEAPPQAAAAASVPSTEARMATQKQDQVTDDAEAMNETLSTEEAEALRNAVMSARHGSGGLHAEAFTYQFKFDSSNLCYGSGRSKPKSWTSNRKGQYSQASAVRACWECARFNPHYSCGPYPDPKLFCPSFQREFAPMVVVPGDRFFLGFAWQDLQCDQWGQRWERGAIIRFKPGERPATVGKWASF